MKKEINPKNQKFDEYFQFGGENKKLNQQCREYYKKREAETKKIENQRNKIEQEIANLKSTIELQNAKICEIKSKIIKKKAEFEILGKKRYGVYSIYDYPYYGFHGDEK